MRRDPNNPNPNALFFSIGIFIAAASFGAYLVLKPEAMPGVAYVTRWVLLIAGLGGTIGILVMRQMMLRSK
jgi:hypothetical protein